MHYTGMKSRKKTNKATTIKKVLSKKKDEISVHLKQETLAVRYLKVQPFYPMTGEYKLSGQIVSQLRLCGKWLKSAGFHPNAYVSIAVMNGLLVIQLTSMTKEKVQLDT
ncbi:SymE family type I addiction module toxin [Terrimonas sp.]|uniref:SymE family type I addiction module toxin n=1 Tax=Terrimonas sp. TaxID=1914338 RepID=UPI001056E7CC|nr:SymE family type I addiction module toxin [Terrimonas sp.]